MNDQFSSLKVSLSAQASLFFFAGRMSFCSMRYIGQQAKKPRGKQMDTVMGK